MNMKDWFKSKNPITLLTLVARKRQKRLVAIAACRFGWRLMDDRCQKAIEVAERHVDGNATDNELQFAVIDLGGRRGYTRLHGLAMDAAYAATSRIPSARDAIHHIIHAFCLENSEFRAVSKDDSDRQLFLVREQLAIIVRKIVMPFSPYGKPPQFFINEDARRMAESIYDNNDFAALPVLADCLQDSGCDDDCLLAELRSPGSKPKGFWPLDYILGK